MKEEKVMYNLAILNAYVKISYNGLYIYNNSNKNIVSPCYIN